MKAPSLIIEKLVIKGLSSNYVCTFEEGLNVVYGSMDSGKSSILNLINYCLGGKFDGLDYDELLNNGRTVYLTCLLNNNKFTFERTVSSKDDVVKVYPCGLENIDDFYPKLCHASSTGSMPDGWLSDLILDALEIPKVKIKESRIREDSDSYRLSFRDLMKLMYLHQRKVASENIIDHANPAVFNKNKEIQKFIYGVHDDQLVELNEQLKQEFQRAKSLETQIENVEQFFSSTNIQENRDEDYEYLLADLGLLESEEKLVRSSEKLALSLTTELSKEIARMEISQRESEFTLNDLNKQIKDLTTLRTTYEYDLDCLKVTKSFKEKVGKVPEDSSGTHCPLCDSNLPANSPTMTLEAVTISERSLKNRIKGSREVLDKLVLQKANLVEQIKELNKNLAKLKLDFDRRHVEAISPTVNALTKINEAKSEISKKIIEIRHNRRISHKLDKLKKERESHLILIERVKEQIESVQKGLHNIDETISNLSSIFSDMMLDSKLSNNYGSSIDHNFMPVFRDREYSNLYSGGVRTVMSVNLYLSRLAYLLEFGGNLPTFIMLDTPGQNIGKYANKDNNSEEDTSDPAIYEQVYNQMIKFSDRSFLGSSKYQIIVVDNDLPPSMTEGQYHLVKQFSKSNSAYEIGLINDA